MLWKIFRRGSSVTEQTISRWTLMIMTGARYSNYISLKLPWCGIEIIAYILSCMKLLVGALGECWYLNYDSISILYTFFSYHILVDRFQCYMEATLSGQKPVAKIYISNKTTARNESIVWVPAQHAVFNLDFSVLSGTCPLSRWLTWVADSSWTASRITSRAASSTT